CDPLVMFFFFFNDTATTEIYTLSLHDALPICYQCGNPYPWTGARVRITALRSEEHTSELQSLTNLVCRLLLEKKKIYLDSEGICTAFELAICTSSRRTLA